MYSILSAHRKEYESQPEQVKTSFLRWIEM